MSRPARAVLSSANLTHNLQTLKTQAPKSAICAMVKANAYGHGLRSVAKVLEPFLEANNNHNRLNSDALGVASIEEAIALRDAGITTPIILMEGFFEPSEVSELGPNNFSVVLHTHEQIEHLKHAHHTEPFYAWVKVDTGMGRLGFHTSEASHVLNELSSLTFIRKPIGVMSHFSCADDVKNPHNYHQLTHMQKLAKLGVPLSLCNSAALLNWPECHHHMVRPGLALYGVNPLQHALTNVNLKPVMSLHTKLISVRHMKKGDIVGYGGTFVCEDDMPIGIAAIGYGDGYPRSNWPLPILVNGVKCYTAGHISMDMAAIDLRPHLRHCKQQPNIGDSVLLWGASENGNLPIEEVAKHAKRSPYEMLTNIQHRVRFSWV